MGNSLFDLEELFRALDAERERRGMSWVALARNVGVSPSTIRRYRDADDAEADGVLALVRWLGVAPEDFVAGTSVPGETLAPEVDGFIRVDMGEVSQVSGEPHRGTRTTIQRLIDVAQRSGRPVAALTRLSKL